MTSEAVQSPKQRYQMQLESGVLTPDSAQAQAVDMLDELYGRILANVNAKKSLLPWRRKVQPEMGLYFWGGVGRGKTHLLDLFAD